MDCDFQFEINGLCGEEQPETEREITREAVASEKKQIFHLGSKIKNIFLCETEK